MIRTLAGALLGAALLTLPVVSPPIVGADSGASYGACVAHHATVQRGFTGDHNPGMHPGYAGWEVCSHPSTT